MHDSLLILRNCNRQNEYKTRKLILIFFKNMVLDISINTNLKEVDFLDDTLCLRKVSYQLCRKSNEKFVYIRTTSNHPPTIIMQISKAINCRLSENSSSESIFNEAKNYYETSLKDIEFSSTHRHPQLKNPTRIKT